MQPRTSLGLGLNLGGAFAAGDGAPAWTPESETGLAFWVDAQNAGSLTLSGSDVTGWADLAESTDLGNGEWTPPPLVTVNGHPMIRLGPAGSGDILTGTVSPAAAITTVGDFTTALVLRGLASAAEHIGILARFLGGSRFDVSVNHLIGGFFVGFGEFSGGYPTLVATLPTHPMDNGKTWLAVIVRSGTTVTLYVANEDVALTSTDSTAINGGSAGTSVEFNKTYVSSQEYEGYVGETIFWNSALDATARANLWSYMQAKWSMTA